MRQAARSLPMRPREKQEHPTASSSQWEGSGASEAVLVPSGFPAQAPLHFVGWSDGARWPQRTCAAPRITLLHVGSSATRRVRRHVCFAVAGHQQLATSLCECSGFRDISDHCNHGKSTQRRFLRARQVAHARVCTCMVANLSDTGREFDRDWKSGTLQELARVRIVVYTKSGKGSAPCCCSRRWPAESAECQHKQWGPSYSCPP